MGSSSLSAPHWRNIGIPWSRAVQSELFSETSMLAARRKNGLGVSRNSAESLSVVPVAIVTWVEPAASLTSNEDGRTTCATGAGGRARGLRRADEQEGNLESRRVDDAKVLLLRPCGVERRRGQVHAHEPGSGDVEGLPVLPLRWREGRAAH